MIFLKYFDVQKQTLFGVSKVYVPRTSKVGDLQGVICEKMRWAPQTPIKLYEVCSLLVVEGGRSDEVDTLYRKSNQG